MNSKSIPVPIKVYPGKHSFFIFHPSLSIPNDHIDYLSEIWGIFLLPNVYKAVANVTHHSKKTRLFFCPKKVPPSILLRKKNYCLSPSPQSDFVKKSLPPPSFLEKSLCSPNTNSLNNVSSTIILRKW